MINDMKYVEAIIQGQLKYTCDLSENNALGNITRLENTFAKIPERGEKLKSEIARLQKDKAEAENHLGETFPKEQEYVQKSARLEELNEIFAVEDTSVVAMDDNDDIEITQSHNEDYEEETSAVMAM